MELIVFYELYGILLIVIFASRARKKTHRWKEWCVLCGILTALSPVAVASLLSFVQAGTATFDPNQNLFVLSFVPWPWIVGMTVL